MFLFVFFFFFLLFLFFFLTYFSSYLIFYFVFIFYFYFFFFAKISYDPPNPLWGATKEDGPGHRFVFRNWQKHQKAFPRRRRGEKKTDIIFLLNHFFPFISVVAYLLMKEEVRQQLQDLESCPPALALYRRFVLEEAERVRFKVCDKE